MFAALDATYLVDPRPSGIAIYSRELVNGLARSYPHDRFLHLYRLKQYRRSVPPDFSNVRSRPLLPVLPPCAPWRRPDLFHALNQRVDVRPSKRVISTFHDLFVIAGEYSSAEFRARFTGQARQAAKRSDLIIAVSEFTKSQVISYLNVEPQRVRVVPHGVHSFADPPALEKREKTILCVGALQVRKNIVRLVEAFERLPRGVAGSWTLVLAGSTAGFGASQILARIESSPLASQIRVRGYVTPSDLNNLYRSASIFAFPSLDEGFGIPILEAMANGIPVLTSNRSALPQVAGDAAILADPYDSDSISHELGRLIEHDTIRETLRRLGLERAKLFPWERTVQETYAVYRELASQS